MMALAYRPDIDGLRAVAVVSVVLFHAGIPGWEGGYTGVDVFFVISGFLITSIIMNDIVQGNFSLARFYERRIRRLLPAIVPVILFAITYTFLYYPNDLFKDFSASILAFFGFASNWLFLSESGYFDAPAAAKPLLHTWSLSIEEQYYLFFPSFMLLVFSKNRNAAFLAVIALFVGSLWLSIDWVRNGYIDTAFYNSFSRIWELMLGSVLAFSGRSITNASLAALARLAGIILIVLPVIFYTEATPFPGIAAIPPVLGSALIIVAGAGNDLLRRFLSFGPVVYVGKISYSLYLWHWVIFVFIFVRWPGATHFHLTLGVLVSFVLSIASYHFIETPFRRKSLMPRRRHIYVFFSIAVLAGVSFGAFGVLTGGVPQRSGVSYGVQNASILELFPKARQQRSAAIRMGVCHFKEGEIDDYLANYDACLTISQEKPNILVLGDSHGADLYVALSENYPDINFLQATGAGCGLRTFALMARSDMSNVRQNARSCAKLVRYALDTASKSSVDGVVLTSRGGKASVFNAALAEAMESIIQESLPDAKIAIFGPTVEFSPAPQNYIRNNNISSEVSDLNLQMNYGISRMQPDVQKGFVDIIQSQGNIYIDKIQFICPDDQCTFFTADGFPVFPDYGHWTLSGARLIGSRIRERYPDLMDIFSAQ